MAETYTDAECIFTERIDYAVQSIMRMLKTQYNYDLRTYPVLQRVREGKVDKNAPGLSFLVTRLIPEHVIQYPHAVAEYSEGKQMMIAPWYAAQSMSKRRKGPAFFARTYRGLKTAPNPAGTMIMMAWANAGKCIADMMTEGPVSRNENVGFKSLQNVADKLPHLFASDPMAALIDEETDHLEYVARLERELGVFIGSTPLEDFLATCTKVKETEFATVYKSERLG